MSGDLSEALLCCGFLQLISGANKEIKNLPPRSNSVSWRESSLLQSVITKNQLVLVEFREKGIVSWLVCGAHMPGGFRQSITPVS